jgi:AraC-like DNA-binding protein
MRMSSRRSALIREIYFHVLAGAQEGALRAALSLQGSFGKIARAIRRIHQSYASGLAVEELAKESGMSVPSFHSHFRSVTRTSPVQYLKSIRLHQARLLMVRNGMTAAGASPVEEVKRMKSEFAVPPAHANAVFVSSH